MFHGGRNPAFSRAIPHGMAIIDLLLQVVIFGSSWESRNRLIWGPEMVSFEAWFPAWFPASRAWFPAWLPGSREGFLGRGEERKGGDKRGEERRAEEMRGKESREDLERQA